MIQSIFYLILAALGLGFLIFIHELGHYFMARRVGMKVEAFGIGFGKPIISWQHKGVKWNLCWLPFGGYVRIAGMEKEGSLEPHQVQNGFFNKRPIDRIKVAIMGPLVNIVFAMIAFTIIWMSGGRQQPFSEHTQIIGWMDAQSKLYERGIRPGDAILKYDNQPVEGFRDLLYALMLDDKNSVRVEGLREDYLNQQATPFDYTLAANSDPSAIQKGMTAIGYLRPASYLVYGGKAELPEGSAMIGSGIEHQDRILWAEGQLIFSQPQLSVLMNDSKSLLTVRRGSKVFLTRIPRIQVSDLRITAAQRAEFDDWQHAAKLNIKTPQLVFIPYNLSSRCVVEKPYTYLDANAEETTQVKASELSSVIPLEEGDKILAVDGVPVTTTLDLLKTIQEKKVQIIVQRGVDLTPVASDLGDREFYAGVNWPDLRQLIQGVGVQDSAQSLGNLAVLRPVTPRAMNQFSLPAASQAFADNRNEMRKKEIGKLEDSKQQATALRLLEEHQKRLMLGLPLQDRLVHYNPSPFVLFGEVVDQTLRTMRALVSGYLSPKWLAGPIGMVGVIQYGWSVGIKEAIFWMGMISLNLGLINLFPIPVLDGGHICFSLWEWITKKRIKAKTMEKWIVPFVVLIVAFFIYVTYQDLARLLGKFF